MQVILSLFFSVKATRSSSVTPLRVGRVVLMKMLWVGGIWSSMVWRASRSAKGSPPVKTKSHLGVMLSMVRMLSQIFSRLKPTGFSYSCLLMQKGQWLPQS